MKRITFSADEHLIEAARTKAQRTQRTLNDEFRAWLAEYVGREERVSRAGLVIDHLCSYATTSGRRFSRDEMNAR